MKFLIDTVNLDEIREAQELGVLDGVMISPSLAAKEKVDFKIRLKEICQVVKEPVHAEIVSTDKRSMLKEAAELLAIADHITIKLPAIKAGIKALKELAKQGASVNIALCFQPLQALAAAKAGASYVSPYIGQIEDQAGDVMQIVGKIRGIFDNYEYKTQILIAGIRHPTQLMEAALAGADIAAVPFAVIDQMLSQPMTEIGLKKMRASFTSCA